MTTGNSCQQTCERIERAIERVKVELPPMANLLDAFKDLLVERTRFKAALPDDESFQEPETDPEEFRQGVPILARETFLFPGRELRKAADRLLPAMVRGFPKVGKQLMAVQKALQEGRLDLEREGAAFLKEQWEVLEHTAVDLETDVQILKFVLAQVIKPLAEKRAERFLPLPGGLQWLKGYCPICGSWPAVGFLRGEEGRRFLKCSFCGHEWQFVRTACPFCENNDPGSLELFYAEDRMWERLEVCHRCKRYLVAIDLRDRLEDVVMEVAPLGLVYLDIIAQEKGFRPGAVTEWNIIDDSRLASDDGEYSDAFS